MTGPTRVLCVDDEPNVLNAIQRLFLDEEYEILTALSGAEGLELLARNASVQVVIADYRMPGMNGVDFLKEVCRRWPETIRVVLSGYADIAAVVSAINEGQIYKFIPKPWNDEELKLAVGQAAGIYRLQQDHLALLKGVSRCNTNHDLMQTETPPRLSENELDMRAILDSLSGGVLILDNRKLVVQCNRACCHLFCSGTAPAPGLPAHEILPADVLAFIDTAGAEDHPQRLALHGRELEARMSIVSRGGTESFRIFEFWERR